MYGSQTQTWSPMSVDSDHSQEESMNISDCELDGSNTPLKKACFLGSPVERTFASMNLLDSSQPDRYRPSGVTMTPNRAAFSPDAPSAFSPMHSTRQLSEQSLGYLALDDFSRRKKSGRLSKRHTIACFQQVASDDNDNIKFHTEEVKESQTLKLGAGDREISKPDDDENERVENTASEQLHFCGDSRCKSTSLCFSSVVVMSIVVLGAALILGYVIMVPHICKSNLELDLSALEESLQSKVFGQTEAVKLVWDGLHEYISGNMKQKSLVMSLHGWTGVGKNHITNIVTSHIKTKSVQRFIIPLHFPHKEEEDLYAKLILNETVTGLRNCAINVVIFDEVDKAGPVLVNSIAHAIKETTQALKEDMKLIFLLLSNTGGRDINTFVYETLIKGGKRSDIKAIDLNAVLLDVNKHGKSWHFQLRDNNLIDYFVPLIPLGSEEVKMCIAADMKLKGLEPDMEQIWQVNQHIQYFPKDTPLFSVTGCRAVAGKVDQVLL